MSDDTRQTKLDLTISSVSPARLEQTRADVEVEIERQKLSTPKPEVPPEPEPGGPSEEASPASEATQRLKKLDLIQDVQLILVDKYRTGTKLMWGALSLMMLSLFATSGLILKNFELHNRIAQLAIEQQKLIERGAQIERKTDETSQKVDDAKQKLDETKEKVDQAVESAPKFEIDSQGKAKVVLPVKTSEPRSKKPPSPPTPKQPPSSPPDPPAPPHASSAPLPASIPIEPRGF